MKTQPSSSGVGEAGVTQTLSLSAICGRSPSGLRRPQSQEEHEASTHDLVHRTLPVVAGSSGGGREDRHTGACGRTTRVLERPLGVRNWASCSLAPSILVPWFSLAPVSTTSSAPEKKEKEKKKKEKEKKTLTKKLPRATVQTTKRSNCYGYAASRSAGTSQTRNFWPAMHRSGLRR